MSVFWNISTTRGQHTCNCVEYFVNQAFVEELWGISARDLALFPGRFSYGLGMRVQKTT